MNFPPPSEGQARVIWLALTGLAFAVLAGLVIAMVWGLGRVLHILSPVLWPLAVAAVVACLLDPVVDWLQAHRIPRTRAILMVFFLALMLVALLLASVVPQLVVETRLLADRIPAYTTRFQKQVEDWINHPPELLRKFLSSKTKADLPKTEPSAGGTNVSPSVPSQTPAPAALAMPEPATNGPPGMPNPGGSAVGLPFLSGDGLQSATDWVARTLPAAGRWLAQIISYLGAWFGVLAGLALVPVYAFYFLSEKSGISSQWTAYLPVQDSRFKQELVFVLTAIQGYIIAFFRGQLLVAISDGILYGLGFLIIGLPYALLIGCMAMVLTMIPFLGAIVTCITALVLAVVNFGDWLHPLLVLAVFAVVQTLEGVFISPKIIGDKVGLHPVTIIISVMAGTTLLGGLLGGILAIPLTAALRVLMFRYIWKRPTS